jgi:hypothetical protein
VVDAWSSPAATCLRSRPSPRTVHSGVSNRWLGHRVPKFESRTGAVHGSATASLHLPISRTGVVHGSANAWRSRSSDTISVRGGGASSTPYRRREAISFPPGSGHGGHRSCTPRRLPWRLHGLEHAAATAVGPGPHFRPHQAKAMMVATHLTPAVRGMEEASICPSSGTPRGHLPHLRWADPSPPTHFPGFFEVSLYSFFPRFRGYFLSLTLK